MKYISHYANKRSVQRDYGLSGYYDKLDIAETIRSGTDTNKASEGKGIDTLIGGGEPSRIEQVKGREVCCRFHRSSVTLR